MPPDKGGSNRFKDLEDEMTAKPKRPKRYNATSDFFGPTPCEVNNIHQWGADPKYLLLEFANKEKKLTSINPFLIAKTLENITKTIKTFKPTREGKYLILVPNLIEAEKVKGAFKEVLGEKVIANSENTQIVNIHPKKVFKFSQNFTGKSAKTSLIFKQNTAIPIHSILREQKNQNRMGMMYLIPQLYFPETRKIPKHSVNLLQLWATTYTYITFKFSGLYPENHDL